MRGKRRKAIEIQLEKAADACAERGARLTKLRRLVLKLILGAEGPTTPVATPIIVMGSNS
jgi:Fe2+ or Zn2+ uptake regulation protein